VRVTKEKARENRERILVEATKLFREYGVLGVGIDALGEAAGFTHGSIYSQFGSKDRLAAAALDYAETTIPQGGPLEEFVGIYLSRQHCDDRSGGCYLAALGGDMPRESATVRKSFTHIVKGSIARMMARLSGTAAARNDEALAIIAATVGAIILARAVDDPKLSDRFLSATKKHVLAARRGAVS
jgi:TetR/AcrR family transcriptional repressor of nem operon